MKKKGVVNPKDENVREDTDPANNKTGDDKEDNTAEVNEPDKDAIISQQKGRLDEMTDKFLRLHAEFDNYKKRTSKERLELIKTASADVISAMLPVLDDFERAINAFPVDEAMKSLKDGLVLIYEKYKAVLTKYGLEEIKSMGEVFNTDLHEAIANVPAQHEEQKGKIIDVTEKGYYLNGVVLRFAKVVVAS